MECSVQTLGQAVDLFRCCIFTIRALTVVLPAFLIAGAVVVFVSSESVMKYLGAKANRIVSYGVSAVSGNVLTVCSCNVVPIFAGILRRGAGIGPAFCFVYAAPAIHIVNTIFTYRVIGWQLALWRFFSVPVIAVIIGVAMALIFRRDERERQEQVAAGAVALVGSNPGHVRRGEAFVGFLVIVLVFGAWVGFERFFPRGVGQYVQLGLVILAVAALALLAARWFGREEAAEWGRQTYLLLGMILPIFIPAVIVIALIVAHIPLRWITPTQAEAVQQHGIAFGTPEGNSLLPTLIAAVFGTLMYFPMLTEVAFVKGLLIEKFAVGPALALLLGGPGLSLPGLLLVSRVAGWKKALVYWLCTVVLITAVAYFFGVRYGPYLCPCQQAPPQPT